MNFLRITSRVFRYSNHLFKPSTKFILSYPKVNEITRPVTTYNDQAKSKYRPPNQEERLAAQDAKIRSAAYDKLLTAIGERTVLTPEQWREYYNKANSREVLFMLDIIKMLKPPKDSLEIAKNYLKAFDIESNMVIDKHLLELYAKRYREKHLTEDDEIEVLKICDKLIEKECHLLPELQDKIILGLSITKQWKRALSFANVRLTEAARTVLVHKSIRSKDLDCTWQILDGMHSDRQTPAPSTIRTFIKYCEIHAKQKIVLDDHLPRMLGYMEKFQQLINEGNANQLMELLKREGKDAQKSPMDYDGVCNACKQSLEPVKITADELRKLKTVFFHQVVKGRNIYEKTSAPEWDAFTQFIQENGPFDLVVDGLNIAHKVNNLEGVERSRPCGFKLAEAIEELAETGKRILVIGRKHMKQWPREALHRLQSKARLFLVDNISKDDLFLIYAAMANESNPCDILSNDFMRQHRDLRSEHYREVMQRWQQTHWYGLRFDNTGKRIIFQPNKFKNYCHFHNGRWHLPILTKEEIADGINWFETKKLWLCIKL